MGHRQSDAGDRSCTQLPDDDLDDGILAIEFLIHISTQPMPPMHPNLLALQKEVAGASVSSCHHTTCRSLPYPKTQHAQVISRPEDSARAPSLVVLQLCKSMYRSWGVLGNSRQELRYLNLSVTPGCGLLSQWASSRCSGSLCNVLCTDVILIVVWPFLHPHHLLDSNVAL